MAFKKKNILGGAKNHRQYYGHSGISCLILFYFFISFKKKKITPNSWVAGLLGTPTFCRHSLGATQQWFLNGFALDVVELKTSPSAEWFEDGVQTSPVTAGSGLRVGGKKIQENAG